MEHTDLLIEREKSGRATNAKGWPPAADEEGKEEGERGNGDGGEQGRIKRGGY